MEKLRSVYFSNWMKKTQGGARTGSPVSTFLQTKAVPCYDFVPFSLTSVPACSLVPVAIISVENWHSMWHS